MASAGGGSPRDRGKQAKKKMPSTSEESSGDEDNVYEVEKILAMAKRNGKMMYKVRWLGYSPQFDTWEPYENVASCKDLVDEYTNNMQKKKRRSNSADKSKTEGDEETAKRKRGLQSKKEDDGSMDTKEEEHEVPKLKDSFWKDLEEGRINVFDGDMYSKVKGRASSKASSSDEQSSKESKPRTKTPPSVGKAQEHSRRREKSKDSKASHRKTRRRVNVASSSESELDTETVVAAQTESRQDRGDSQETPKTPVANDKPTAAQSEMDIEIEEPMEVDVVEEIPKAIAETPKAAPVEKTSTSKGETSPVKNTRTSLKVQQKTTTENVEIAATPAQPKQDVVPTLEPKQASTPTTQLKPNETKQAAVAPKPKQVATASQQLKQDATPQGKQSSTQQTKPSAITTTQAKCDSAPTTQSKSTSAAASVQSKSSVTSTPQPVKPSVTTSQTKSSAAASDQPKPAVTPTQDTKFAATSTPQSKLASVPKSQTKQAVASTPQPKQVVSSTPQSKQAVASTPQSKHAAPPTPQPKEAATPSQPKPSSDPRLSRRASLPSPQLEPKMDSAFREETSAPKSSEKETPTPVGNISATNVPIPSTPVKPLSPTTEEAPPTRISFAFKKYNPDDWTRKDSYELTQAVELSNAQFRHAVKRGDYEVLRRALNSNQPFNLEQADNNGTTLLMIAAIAGFDDLVELLVMHGANINACQKNGCTALMLAAELGHVCTVVVLLGLGAHVDIQQTNGETALMRACRKGHGQVVQLLLEHGANFAAVTNSDITALKFAKSYDHPAIENLLVDHISRLTSAFETQVNITLNNTAQINHALFPIHCFSLNEGTCFKVYFNHMLTQSQPGVGMLLFIAHARITSQEVKCRFYGQCAVTSVYLNATKQPSLTEEANFVLSFSPLKNGRNELVINTLQTFTSKVKLFVCAYKAQLAGTTRVS